MDLKIENGRRKSFPIEYVVVTTENIQGIAEWAGGVIGGGSDGEEIFVRIVDKNAINSHQNKAFVGDVVVHHLELKTFKKFGIKSFNKSYEAVEKRVIHRDSGTGEIITAAAAEADPDGTTSEQIEFARSFEESNGLTDTEKEADKNAALPRDADPS